MTPTFAHTYTNCNPSLRFLPRHQPKTGGVARSGAYANQSLLTTKTGILKGSSNGPERFRNARSLISDYRTLSSPSSAHALILMKTRPLDQHPAAVYLASFSAGSRRTMHQALDAIAGMLTNGQSDAFSLNWSAVRYQHTAAVRSRLADQYKPATANKMLSALRQVLHHAWKLGQMSAEDYHRARAVETVKGETLPAGRDLSAGEIAALLGVCEADPTSRWRARCGADRGDVRDRHPTGVGGQTRPGRL